MKPNVAQVDSNCPPTFNSIPAGRKIWLLLDSRQTGGIESHVLQLAQGLAHHQLAVRVVFMTDHGEHPLKTQLEQSGIDTVTLAGSGSKLSSQSVTALWRAIRCEHPSLIHSHGYKAGILGRLFARLLNIPVISTYHAGEIPSGKLACYDWLDRHTAWLANKIFTVSPQISDRLAPPSEVMDNFIDLNKVPISYGEQVAFVGRLSWEKGPDLFCSLGDKLPQTNFHVFGQGPMSRQLESKSPANIHFHGLQPQMDICWQKIGLLVMPSRAEGLPMAALEAMAHGIPVVATRVGALDQLIENNRNGWLTEPGDLNRLASHISNWQLLALAEQQKVRLCARQTIANRFSSDLAIPKLIQRYRQVAPAVQ